MNAAAYARQLQALLPRGVAWNLEPTSRLSKLLGGVSEELARVDGRGVTLIDESDPRTAFETLADWERILNLPDACVVSEQSVEQRRASIVAKLIALGGHTPAYFVAVADALGFAVTITEFPIYDVEDDADSLLYGSEWAFTWQVHASLGSTSSGEMSVESFVDEALSWWINTSLECVLQRLKPAHTTVLFSYS